MPNILIVEDDEMNRTMMARHLNWEGYTVITAANGVQAVALAQSGSIDLILMDMGLPIMTGWEATRRLKTAPATCAIPIIALTAYALSEDRAKCFQVGCDEYESKPIDFQRLFAKMSRFLNNTPAASIHKDTGR
jgi:CheY-like chemotaxis protein